MAWGDHVTLSRSPYFEVHVASMEIRFNAKARKWSKNRTTVQNFWKYNVDLQSVTHHKAAPLKTESLIRGKNLLAGHMIIDFDVPVYRNYILGVRNQPGAYHCKCSDSTDNIP